MDSKFFDCRREKPSGDEFDFYRSMEITNSSFDEKTRSVSAVMATETPCPMPDFRLGGMVDEILPMEGAVIPDQVPLLDNHDDSSVMKQLGSTREIKTLNGQMVGRRFFDDSSEADKAIGLIRGGHLRDGSIRYRYSNPVYINVGDTGTVHGKTYSPTARTMRIPMSWSLVEDSICPIGADPNAKMRRRPQPEISSGENKKEKKPMNPYELWLVARGHKDPGALDEETRTRLKTLFDQEQAEETRRKSQTIITPEDVARAAQKAADDAISYVQYVESTCARHGVSDIARAFIDKKTPVAEVNAGILARLEATRAPVSVSITPVADELDKFRTEAVSAILIRAGKAPIAIGEKRNDFAGMSMIRMAEECLERDGIKTRGMSRSEIAKRALLTSSSSYPYLMSTSANKMLQTAYQNEASTFEAWTKIVPAKDYKTMDRIQLSDAPSMSLIKEGADYPMAQPSSAKEAYAIGKYGEMFCLTRELVINDDLNAFARIPTMFGAAARRKINDIVYAILTDNAALGNDSVALFDVSTHKNYITASATLGATYMSAARAAMRIQTGPKGAILNLRPAFLIVPAALETTAMILINSERQIVGTTAATGGDLNPFRGSVQIVVEPRLDANDTDMWYLAAAQSQIDTVEVAFLDGNTSPYLEEEVDFDSDGRKYKVRVEFGAKAIDYRGLYCSRNT